MLISSIIMGTLKTLLFLIKFYLVYEPIVWYWSPDRITAHWNSIENSYFILEFRVLCVSKSLMLKLDYLWRKTLFLKQTMGTRFTLVSTHKYRRLFSNCEYAGGSQKWLHLSTHSYKYTVWCLVQLFIYCVQWVCSSTCCSINNLSKNSIMNLHESPSEYKIQGDPLRHHHGSYKEVQKCFDCFLLYTLKYIRNWWLTRNNGLIFILTFLNDK